MQKPAIPTGYGPAVDVVVGALNDEIATLRARVAELEDQLHRFANYIDGQLTPASSRLAVIEEADAILHTVRRRK